MKSISTNVLHWFTVSLFLLLVLIPVTSTYADTIYGYDGVPKNQPKLVNDFANIMSSKDELELEGQLKSLHDSKDIKFTVVTMNFPRKGGLFPIKKASKKIFSEWKLEKTRKQQAILMVVSPDDNMAHIRFGEAYDSDYDKFQKITDEYINPALQKKDYYGAINLGTEEVTHVVFSPFKRFVTNIYFIFTVILLLCIYLIKEGRITFGNTSRVRYSYDESSSDGKKRHRVHHGYSSNSSNSSNYKSKSHHTSSSRSSGLDSSASWGRKNYNSDDNDDYDYDDDDYDD